MEKIWKGKKEKKNNKYNVLLESFLLKKVKIEDVHFFSNNNNLDTDLNEKQFYICISEEDFILEACNSKRSNSNINLTKLINPNKPLQFKIGPLNDMIQEKKDNQYPNGICYALLAFVKVGKFQTYFDLDDPEKEIDKTKLIFTEKECYYIHSKNSDEFNTDNNHLNKKLNYYFITTNDAIVKPDCLIAFKYDDYNNSTCSKCKLQNATLKYCLNDKLYFCPKCDEELHNGNKLTFNSLKKHKRISNIDFTVTHDSVCTFADHDKPYEIYCSECEELFCITCLANDLHINHGDKKQSIIYLNDGLLEKILMEQNLLNKDMDSMTRRINNKIIEYERYAKLVDGYNSEIAKEILERKNKATDGISKETLRRTTYLMCTMMELQRLMWEIDSKINYIKNLYSKNDFPKFLSMIKVFDDYIKNDFLKNLKIIMERKLDGLSDGFYKLDQKKK